MLAVYTFVFGTILEIRWIEQKGGNLEFATILFSGLIIHSYFSECLQSSVQLITDNRQYVKKVVFPLEALAWVAILTSLFQVAVSTGVLLLYLLLVQGALSWTIIFLPIILAPLMLFALGISWIISSTAVYLRDIGQLVGPITLILLFVSPIFYPVSSIPSEFQFLLYLNPITWVVDQVRNAMLWGLTPHIQGYLVYLVFAFLVSWIGFSVFKKLRPGFSDVV
jgi:lipopolysaccharide transport system permease protein